MGRKRAIIGIIVICMAMATMGSDEQDCANDLTNLASCIPFVSGTATKPTPDCCQNAQKLKSTKPKCLCVLIKESTDPSMGLPVNTTLALQMPSACNLDAKVSDCPSILNIPADSPDAKIFKDSSSDSTTATTASTDSPPSSSTGSSSSSSSSDTGSKSTTSSTNNGAKIKLFGGGITMAFAAFIFFI